jgi:hypothetical protein
MGKRGPSPGSLEIMNITATGSSFKGKGYN